MASVALRSAAGSEVGTVELDDRIFGIEPNESVMHQVVTAQLAARRRGTQSTKTRAEVRGGGAKPWAQKGTGRARQGSIRSPQWRGGGVALGPKPRSYAQKTPKKMVRLALRSALSDRAAAGQIIVIDSWGFEAPKTAEAVKALASLGVEGRALVVLDGSDTVAWKSFQNLDSVHLLASNQLNTYDVLVSDSVIFTADAVPTLPAADESAADESAVGEAAAVEDSSAGEPTVEEPVVEESAADDSADEGSGSDDSGAAEPDAGDGSAPYGPGSAAPLADDSAPEGFTIKGNEDSMKYHTEDSAFYGRTIAEVWFDTVESAEAAGFVAPGGAKKAAGSADTSEDE